MTAEDQLGISVAVAYGHRTRKGLVEVKMGTEAHMITPSKAREIATFLIEAAGAAEGDEALMKVLERAGADEGRAAQMLMAMRSERSRIDAVARDEARRAIAHDQFDPDVKN